MMQWFKYMLLYCTFGTCKILSILIYKTYSSDYPISFDAKHQQPYFAFKYIFDHVFPL